MKKLYYLQILGLCIVVFQSCSKDSGNNAAIVPSSNSIDIVIAHNQTYQLNLSGAANVNIFKQASHYQTSETVSNTENASIIYTYLPDANYTGKDQVMLSTTTLNATSGSSSGCPNSNHADNTNSAASATYSTSYTTINITVTN